MGESPSAHQAVAQAQRYVAEGLNVVVDLDLEKFFDRVNHDCLIARDADGYPASVYPNSSGISQCRADGRRPGRAGRRGDPQGGPLSPLLSNIMLDDLDKELTRRELRFVRYADDCVPRRH